MPVTPLLTVPGSSGHHQHFIDLCTDSSLPPPSLSTPLSLSSPTKPPAPQFLHCSPCPFLFGSGTRDSQPLLHNKISRGVVVFLNSNVQTLPHTNYIRGSGTGAHAHIISQSSFYVAKVENHLWSSSSKPCPGVSSPFILRKAINVFS